MRIPMPFAFALTLLLGLASSAKQVPQAQAAAAPAVILLGDCLVLSPVFRGVRSFVFTDPIEHQYAQGTLRAPKAGDVVAASDAKESTWEAARGNENGEVRHAALAGGYLWWTVKSEVEEPRVLVAQGHIGVYVNGEPRFGDPYNTGYVQLPVLLKKGENHLVFRAIRGFVSARLVDAKVSPKQSGVAVQEGDELLPDLVEGRPGEYLAAIVVRNFTAETQYVTARAIAQDADKRLTWTSEAQVVQPFSTRKVRVSLWYPGTRDIDAFPYRVMLLSRTTPNPKWFDFGGGVAVRTLSPRVRKATETRKVTFVSKVDGSVQYYALRPAQVPPGVTNRPGIVLSLHGASVEASGQAGAYGDKSWCHIVCPTNRRPFGFDWEDWGRLDALEVLEHARASLDHDPSMIYLTGHSMGGHGTWQLGAHFPSKFAAIAPCAGWRSFYTYGGKRDPEMDEFAKVMRRADNPGDTPLLIRNHGQHGVFIVHGDADETVPVAEARAMRDAMKEFHKDLHYYEQPGGGHWYDTGDANGDTGADCVDYQPIFDLFAKRRVPSSHEVREIDFTTMSPGISAECHWATVEQQLKPLEPSRIQLRADPNMRRISGTTRNVRVLKLDVDSALRKGDKLSVVLDGTALDLPWPQDGTVLLGLGKQWELIPGLAAGAKNPARYGGFKDAFRNNFIIVYGTGGDEATRRWAQAKARLDAEHFYVRGNGSVDVVSDTEFASIKHAGRNIILIGSADMNSAHAALKFECPVNVQPGKVTIGERTLEGDLAVLAVYPRPGDDNASIGVISGTSLKAMRLTNRLPYLASGVGVPDFVVLDAEMLRDGAKGMRACGYFDMDWKISAVDTVIR